MLNRVIKTAARQGDDSELFAANIIKSHLKTFEKSLDASKVIGGNPELAIQKFNEGRALALKQAKARIVAKIFSKAENAVGANYTSAGYQTALRQKFRALADNDAKMAMFNKEEQDLIHEIVRGTDLENNLRKLGKLGITGNVSLGVNLGVGAVLGPHVAMGAAAAGAAAKHLSTKMAIKNATKLDEGVRRGSFPQPLPPPQRTKVSLANKPGLGTLYGTAPFTGQKTY
jgi:hypothetical protein